MADTAAMRALADVLVWLSTEEESAARRYGPEELELRRRVTAEWPPIDHFSLRRLLNHRLGHSVSIGDDKSKFIYGPASRRGGLWLPVVSLMWNFGPADPVFRLYIAMFVVDGTRLKASGHRFETPEAGGPPHRFFHVQRITAFGRSGKSLPVTQPVNVRQPAIPLDAGSPVSVALAALVALYDVDFLRRVVTGAPRARPYARELRCL